MTTTFRPQTIAFLIIASILFTVDCPAQMLQTIVCQQASLGQLDGMKKRQTADDLLARARAALAQGNLELAEWYVNGAERLEVEYGSLFTKFSDSPKKVREAIEFRRNTMPKPAQRGVAAKPAQSHSNPAALSNLDGKGIIPGASKADAIALLKRAQQSIEEGETDRAVRWYRSAVALRQPFAANEFSPKTVHDMLIAKGVPAAELQATSPGATHLPPPQFNERAVPIDLTAGTSIDVPSQLTDPQAVAVNSGDSISASSLLERGAKITTDESKASRKPTSQRQRVLRLLAEAQAALDRDEVELAEQFAFSAQDVRLPEAAYQPGDVQPWMVLMEISRAQRRQRTTASGPIATKAKGDAFFKAPERPVAPPAKAESTRVADDGDFQPVALAEPKQVAKTETTTKSNTATADTAQSSGAPSADQLAAPSGMSESASRPRKQPIAHPVAVEGSGGRSQVAQASATLASNASRDNGNAVHAPARIPQVATIPASAAIPSGVANVPRRGAPVPTQFASNQIELVQMQQLVAPTQSQMPKAELPGTVPLTSAPQQDSPNPTAVPDWGTTPKPTPSLSASPEWSGASPNPPAARSRLQVPALAQPKAPIQPPTVHNPTMVNIGDLGNSSSAMAPDVTRRPTSRPVDPRSVTETRTEPEAGSFGMQIYRQGVDALSNGNLNEAEGLFREAWNYESEFDADTRQSLQDHLQFVRQQVARRTQTANSIAASQHANPPNVLGSPKSLKRSTPSISSSLAEDKKDPVAELAEDLTRDSTDEQQQTLERLLSEMTRKQIAIQAMRSTEPKKAWDEMNLLRERIVRAKIADEPRSQLLRRMDRQITELEKFIEQNRGRIENDERNQQILAEIDRRRELKNRNEQKLAHMVEQFNTLMNEQRFSEAVILAKQARELDPLNPVVENMVFKSRTARQIRTQLSRDEKFREATLATLDSVDEAAVGMSDEWNMEFPRYWDDLTKRRKDLAAQKQRRYTDVELEIKKSLKKQVDVQFDDTPLSVVLDKLARMVNINVYIDPEGLVAEGVTSDQTVSINFRQPLMLESALNLILEPLHLSYVVQNEVLRITSEQVKDGDVYTEIYNVADLVIPIPNFVPSYNIGLPGAIREAHRVMSEGYMGGVANSRPMTLMADNPGMGANSTEASVVAQMGASGMVSSMGGGSNSYGPNGAGGGTNADFDTLIELITTTIEPDTWEELGGPGAIDGFPGNLSLVVSQTQDIHERIVDLLEQLRRLQDLQVTIEVRFIELNDDFFERIGIDFDFDIEDGNDLSPADISPSVDQGPNVVVGLQPGTMTPTSNLDIPFTQGSFNAAIPAFGGFTPDAAANIGFAILSDIEAYFMIQASQGDSRSNILTAPKVTLYNGQTAFVSSTSQRPFVTSVIPIVGDFAAAHQPVITVLTEGTSLSVEAVVSQDRRFIRLTLVPFFSQIGDVDTFTFNGSTTSDTGTTTVDPTGNGNNVTNNASQTTSGTTVQLPTFSFTTVNTTVSVPDGGTILLGGIKSLSEGRNEQGVPMLSKLPYVNRLFKNVGIGRDSRSLMMMVTPRIIIQDEQEELQVGSSSTP